MCRKYIFNECEPCSFVFLAVRDLYFCKFLLRKLLAYLNNDMEVSFKSMSFKKCQAARIEFNECQNFLKKFI